MILLAEIQVNIGAPRILAVTCAQNQSSWELLTYNFLKFPTRFTKIIQITLVVRGGIPEPQIPW